MKKSSFKKRYFIFIITVMLTIIANEAILHYKLNLQRSDAKIINMAGRQRMLSQKITKHLLYMGYQTQQVGNDYTKETLSKLVKEFDDAHNLLKFNALNTSEISILFQETGPFFTEIVNSSRAVIKNPSRENITSAIQNISKVELDFLTNMENIVLTYQKEAEAKLSKTTNTVLVLSIISILILIAEFIFIIVPLFNSLFEKNKALGTANRRLSDFAYITSHNLRAPVSNLNSLLYLVQNEEDETEKRGLLTKFEKVINNLNTTMNTLVDALKTQNKADHVLENINLNEVLNKTVENLSSTVSQTKASISHDFSQLENVTYDKVYLESIFQNLIGNSLKYRSPERHPKINVTSRKKNGKAQLLFIDNGLGIDLKRHGEKLFGLNKTFHRHPDAKGVGLFMTRTQIESIGGSITAESEVNVGTSFTITL